MIKKNPKVFKILSLVDWRIIKFLHITYIFIIDNQKIPKFIRKTFLFYKEIYIRIL